jgi:hypothetical protein
MTTRKKAAPKSPSQLGAAAEASKRSEARRAATSTRPTKKAAKAVATKAATDAATFVDAAVATALADGSAANGTKPKRSKGPKAWPCTKEEIEAARDGQGLSWRDVGVLLGIGSPGQARTAYTALTGRDHSTSVMTGRRARSGTSGSGKVLVQAKWEDMSGQEIVDHLLGHRIILKALPGGTENETLYCGKVHKLTGDGDTLAVEIVDARFYPKGHKHEGEIDPKSGSGASRTIRLNRILEVR